MDETEPTPDELREAAALASDAPPQDVAATAALLRFSRTGGLSPDRRETVWRRIGASGRMPRARWARRFGVIAAATAAVAFAVLAWRWPQTRLPRPELALLQAQSRAASGDRAAAGLLDEQMRSYRSRMLASLEQRYRQ